MQCSEETVPLRSLQNIFIAKDREEDVKKKKRPKKEKPTKCIDCKIIFTSLKSYDEHHCRGSGAFFCDFCDRSYNQFKRLVTHIIYSHLENNRFIDYTCDICRKTCKRLNTLQIHILSAHYSIEHRCEKCYKRFPNKSDITNHLCKDLKIEQCPQCGEFFNTKQIKAHSKTHVGAFKCKYCSCKIASQVKYDAHLAKLDCSKAARNEWLDKYDQTTCRECKRCFESDKELISHFKFYHKGLPHQCFYCDTQLHTFEDLKTHSEIHFSQKLIYCDLCGKQYTSKEGYRKHRIKHNGNDFKCQFCQRQFLSEKRFSGHLLKCKRNPKNGVVVTTERSFKSSRQLNWESRIIVKKVRGVEDSMNDGNVSNDAQVFEIDKPLSPLSDRSGWFDAYYGIGKDDLKFGALSDGGPDTMDDLHCDDPPPLPSEESDSSNGSGDEVEEKIDFNPKLCRICDNVFSLEYELIHHFIKTHPGAVPHKCPHCTVEAPLFAQLKEHLKVHGIGLGVHHCGNCSKTFRSASRLRVHYAKCTGNNTARPLVETCKRCGKTYQTKCGYKRHKRICKVEKRVKEARIPDIYYSDEGGGDPEPEPLDLDPEPQDSEPVKIEEPAPLPPKSPTHPPSPVVPKVKDEPKLLLQEPPKNSYPCRLCSSSFQYERGIVMHFKAEHPSEKPLICHICGLMLADKLKEHLKTHGIGEEFVCELCDKRFNQKFMSKIHEMWHQGIEYKCRNCKQKFLNQEKMEKHVAEGRCRNRLSLMRLPCDICGKSYRSKFGLNCHSLTHTPRDLRPVKNKMNCEFCGKWFDSNNGLVRHRRTHTGEKPYCCKSCPRAFAQESNCKAHERTHTGEARPRKKKVNITVAPDLPVSPLEGNRTAHVFTTFGPPPQIDQARPPF